MNVKNAPLKVSYFNKAPFMDFFEAGMNEAGFPTNQTDFPIDFSPEPCIRRNQGTLYNGRRYIFFKSTNL